MSNITITSTANTIELNYGDYAAAIGLSKSLVVKSGVKFVNLAVASAYVETAVNNLTLPLVYIASGSFYIVDSVDGVAPTSNSDLYDKMAALIGKETITKIDEASATIRSEERRVGK